MAKDPVCGMEVDVQTTQNKCEYKAKMYYFCTPLCMVTFQNDPEKYLKNSNGER